MRAEYFNAKLPSQRQLSVDDPANTVGSYNVANKSILFEIKVLAFFFYSSVIYCLAYNFTTNTRTFKSLLSSVLLFL